MARIPANSLLSTEFSKVWLKPTRRPNRYKLVLGGEELNTVWFQERPSKGYGYFQLDQITGRKAWTKLFSGDNPNSILSGNGRSLVFETGHFTQKGDGRFVSRIQPLAGAQKQDVVTGRWHNSSLFVDSTDSADSTSMSVEGLSTLLVVASCLVLYNKIRANRVLNAIQEDVDNIENDIDKTKSNIAEAEANLQATKATQTPNIEEIKELEEKIAGLQEKLKDLESNKEALNQLSVTVKEELEESLSEVANSAKPFETDAFEADLELFLANMSQDFKGQNELKLFSDMVKEDTSTTFAYYQDDLKEQNGDNYTSTMEFVVAKALQTGSYAAYRAFVQGTPEGIDQIVEVYSEEFTIEETEIFRASSGKFVFQSLLDGLGDAGFESEVFELTEYVEGPIFAEDAGSLIGAFTNGSLGAEEAVSAWDIASIGLSGDAFVDSVAAELGGDTVLGEFAIDLIEIAAAVVIL